jgi:hypothetical protein
MAMRGIGKPARQPDNWRRFWADRRQDIDLNSDIRDKCAAMRMRPGSSSARLAAKKCDGACGVYRGARICPLEPSMPEGTSTERIGFSSSSSIH